MQATVENLFMALDMSQADAVQSADVVIYADVRGIDSHGVSNMMRAYVHGFQGGHRARPQRGRSTKAGSLAPATPSRATSGANWNAEAPVPITGTWPPARSCSCSHCVEWKAMPL